jgi:LacI family transcriptional regulator
MLALPDPPTAFFTARNVLTVGAVRALRDLGLRDTVALVGFDDFPTADLLEPGVTCVKQAVDIEGELAIDLLLSRMDGDVSPPRSRVVPTSLVPRGSGEIAAP